MLPTALNIPQPQTSGVYVRTLLLAHAGVDATERERATTGCEPFEREARARQKVTSLSSESERASRGYEPFEREVRAR